MARKTPSRKELRKQTEAAEAKEAAGKTKKKKKATKKKTTSRTKRAKVKVPERKRLVWAIFSGSMKEEQRFPYDQRKEAEEKVEKLKSKGKKQYFIQPIKELIPETEAADEEK